MIPSNSDNDLSKSLNQKGKQFLQFLIGLFVVAELLFVIQVMYEGNGDLPGVTLKSLFILIIIYFYYCGFKWAKWILSMTLLLFSAACFLGGFESISLVLISIGCYYLFFGLIIHFSKSLRAITEKQNNKKEEEITDASAEMVPVGIDGFILNNAEYTYPRLLQRIQAVFIDGFLCLSLIVLILTLTSEMESGSRITSIIYVLISVSYIPLFTAYSATLGQKIMGIRIRKYRNPDEKINVLQAYVRLIVQGLFGWLSFITINFNKEHRAIHDIAASSVVIKVKKETEVIREVHVSLK